MNGRPSRTPCLGQRVTALADGSLHEDVRDRALAHTLACAACREALDAERRTLAVLRSLPEPQPSARLVAELLALGEPGGPVPSRRGPGPGMPRPAFVRLAPPPTSTGTVRPGGGSHPGARRPVARRTRTLVLAAAGALGAGFVATGLVSATTATTQPTLRPPTAQLVLPGEGGAATTSFTTQQWYGTGNGFAPALVAPTAELPAAFPAGGRSGVRPAALVLLRR